MTPQLNTPQRPKQARSQATLDRILAAAESLLAEKDFTVITVQDIVSRGATSVGAFYKRFTSKDDLLPWLLARLQARQLESIEQYVVENDQPELKLATRVQQFIGFQIVSYQQHRGLVRALVSRQYSDRNSLPAAEVARSRKVVDTIVGWLLSCRDEISHPDPERAVRMAIFFTVTSLQVSLLFRPRTQDFTSTELAVELERAFLAYLGPGPDTARR